MAKIDINKLNEAVEKAFDRIFEEEEKKEKKEVKPDQWHDDYSNKEENNVIQTRINPDTKKPEFKIPTNDKVYDTRDAAIAALKEGKGEKKVVTLNEKDIRNIVKEALENNYRNSPHYKLGYMSQCIEEIGKRLNVAITELNNYIGEDDVRRYDLAVVLNQLNGIGRCLRIGMESA